jgi:hypothetical protein
MKLCLLLFIAFLNTLFAQKLIFDILIEYDILKNNVNYVRNGYAISNNSDYITQISKEYEGKLTARVYNLKKLKYYIFDIIEDKNFTDLQNCKFVLSSSTNMRTPTDKQHFNFIDISNSENQKSVQLNFYKSKTKTKLINSLELKIIESELNLFPLFRWICIHSLENYEVLTSDKPRLVISGFAVNGKKDTR